MTDTVSLLPDDVDGLIGREIHRASGEVFKKEFQRWAVAVGDLDPLYFDEAFAHELGHPDVVMPQMFISNVLNGVEQLDTLRPDGARNGKGLEQVTLRTTQQMAGGEETDFHLPAYPGDVLEAVFVLESMRQREGRSGPFVLTTRSVTYTNQSGRTVARTLTTIISR